MAGAGGAEGLQLDTPLKAAVRHHRRRLPGRGSERRTACKSTFPHAKDPAWDRYTGQPGISRESLVIDRRDITGERKALKGHGYI